MPDNTLKTLNDIQSRFWSKSKFSKKLFIFFGLLGDFDSVEYAQNLSDYISKIEDLKFDIFIHGIGDETGKKRFCDYTNLPERYLKVSNNNEFHRILDLNTGIDTGINPWLDFTMMLSGLNSPGTISEVLRGYLGDKSAKSIYQDNDLINIANSIKFKGSLFNKAGKRTTLRPFELATYRLRNMEEIISNWSKYILSSNYLTQRGGTFLINNDSLIYEYRPRSILLYSETMNNPLEFLDQQ